EIAEAVEHMDTHSGHSAGAAFLGPHAPAVSGIIRQPIVAVIPFHMHDGAEGPGGLQFGELAHRRYKAEVMPDPDRHAGAFDGVEHGLRVRLAERKRFLAIDVLAGSGDRFHLLTVSG